MRDLRVLLVVLVAAVLLSGCGLFGDTDADATPTSGATDAPVVVRITSGDRWFDATVDAGSLDATNQPTTSFITHIREGIADLGVEATAPTDAGITFDGSAWVAVPAVEGGEPDPESLARAVAAAPAGAQIEVVFAPTTAETTTENAQAFADRMNQRTADGMTVGIDGQQAVLGRDVIGPASTVTFTDGRWDVDIDWSRLDTAVAGKFPNVGQEGGEASFTVVAAEDSDEPGTVQVVPGRAKTVCCGEASASRIANALENDIGFVRLELDHVDGERGTAWAQELGVIERVGTFTTTYTPGQGRVTNIRRIGDLTQGVIIEPGETFSLNDFVGRRTRENGFVPAGTIVNGHLVDSVGGGISQFATTIFNASFFAGLEFDRYQAHSIYFSRYPYGREATISFPAPDLQIHNPTPYGVLIWPTSTTNSITVDIYSTLWAPGEQTGQWKRTVGVACTRVTTERTRTFVEDGRTEVDTVFAVYRPEGIACDGSATQDPDEEQVDALENGDDPNFENGDPPAGDGVPPEEQPTPQDPPAEDPPAEDPPAEDPPAEDPPAEDPPVEDPPAEDPPAEDPPVEDPPAEDPPAEDPPAEDPPVDDPPQDPDA